jgi:hypothetical protein
MMHPIEGKGHSPVAVLTCTQRGVVEGDGVTVALTEGDGVTVALTEGEAARPGLDAAMSAYTTPSAKPSDDVVRNLAVLTSSSVCVVRAWGTGHGGDR